jgi:DNA repair exonuclease SbcCD ATPase subunit
MKLDFNYVWLKQFKSFSKACTFRLDLKPGVHFIRGINSDKPRLGSNGAGKSTIFDALCWVLYGKTSRGLKNPDVAARKANGKTTTVILGITIDDIEYTITRSIRPNKLLIDNKEVGQEQIIELIGMDFPVFTHTILLGSLCPLFFDLTARDKMQLFVDVLDLERWDNRSEIASKKLQERVSIQVGVQSDLSALETTYATVTELKKSLQEQSDEWNAQQETRLQGYVNKRKQRYKELKVQEKLYEDALLGLDGAGVEVKQLESDLARQTDDLARAKNARNKVEAELKILHSQYEQLADQYHQLGEGAHCPTCGQSTKGTALEKQKKQMRHDLAKARAILDAGIPSEIDLAVTTAKKIVHTTQEHLANWRAKEDDAQSTVRRVEPFVNSYKTEIGTLTRQIEEREHENNPYTLQIRKLIKQTQKLEGDRKALTERLGKMNSLVERTKFWVKGFKDVRLFVIEELLQELELTTNAVLDDVGLVGWSIKYAIERETKAGTIQRGLTVSILEPGNETPVRWEAWSGGEGQRLRVIGALALSETLLNHAGVETSIEILDEPTQHLSDIGVNDLNDYLAERARQLKRCIFYIDHASVESSKFASVLTIEKGEVGSFLRKSGKAEEECPF